MNIPKMPSVPIFITNYVDHVSDVVFGNHDEINQFEAMLLFGGSHPGLWEAAIKHYYQKRLNYIFVTGGNKETAQKHESWTYGNSNEADIIEFKLIEGGIPEDIIIKENRSTNSLENVLFIKNRIDDYNIKSLLCICKNYGAGRQYRTIKKYIPNIIIQMDGFETNIDEYGKLTKENWINNDNWKSLVWGEYLRNYFYGLKGDIEKDIIPPREIKIYLDGLMNSKMQKT